MMMWSEVEYPTCKFFSTLINFIFRSRNFWNKKFEISFSKTFNYHNIHNFIHETYNLSSNKIITIFTTTKNFHNKRSSKLRFRKIEKNIQQQWMKAPSLCLSKAFFLTVRRHWLKIFILLLLLFQNCGKKERKNFWEWGGNEKKVGNGIESNYCEIF